MNKSVIFQKNRIHINSSDITDCDASTFTNIIKLNSSSNDKLDNTEPLNEPNLDLLFELSSSSDDSHKSSKEITDNYSSLQNKLQKWAICSKISHSSLTELLHVLSPHHPELPLSSKTFLNTPISNKKILNSGIYVQFGLKTYT